MTPWTREVKDLWTLGKRERQAADAAAHHRSGARSLVDGSMRTRAQGTPPATPLCVQAGASQAARARASVAVPARCTLRGTTLPTELKALRVAACFYAQAMIKRVRR